MCSTCRHSARDGTFVYYSVSKPLSFTLQLDLGLLADTASDGKEGERGKKRKKKKRAWFVRSVRKFGVPVNSYQSNMLQFTLKRNSRRLYSRVSACCSVIYPIARSTELPSSPVVKVALFPFLVTAHASTCTVSIPVGGFSISIYR